MSEVKRDRDGTLLLIYTLVQSALLCAVMVLGMWYTKGSWPILALLFMPGLKKGEREGGEDGTE